MITEMDRVKMIIAKKMWKSLIKTLTILGG